MDLEREEKEPLKPITFPKEVVEGLESIVNTVKFRAENAKEEMETINKLLAKERNVPLPLCHIIQGYLWDYHIFDILNNRGNNLRFGPNRHESYRKTAYRPSEDVEGSQGFVKIILRIPSVYDDANMKMSLRHLWERGEKFCCKTDEGADGHWTCDIPEFVRMKTLGADNMEGGLFSFTGSSKRKNDEELTKETEDVKEEKENGTGGKSPTSTTRSKRGKKRKTPG